MADKDDIEAMRAKVAKADAEAAAKAKDANLALLKPFVDAGIGGDALPEIAKLFRDNAQTLGTFEPHLQSMALTGADLLMTMNDKVRSLIALNSPPPEA